jgi:hypothetical protein
MTELPWAMLIMSGTSIMIRKDKAFKRMMTGMWKCGTYC